MNREEILQAAQKCVCGGREQDYGRPEDNFGVVARLWETYLWATHKEMSDMLMPLNGKDVAIMLALLKIARIATGRDKEDSYIDLAGYAACGGEIASKNQINNMIAGVIKKAENRAECDKELETLWEAFTDIPMNPETECMEAPFLDFPAGTHREEIWHWFDERYSKGVYALLYGCREDDA